MNRQVKMDSGSESDGFINKNKNTSLVDSQAFEKETWGNVRRSLSLSRRRTRFKRMGLAWIVLVWIALIHSDCFFFIFYFFIFYFFIFYFFIFLYHWAGCVCEGLTMMTPF